MVVTATRRNPAIRDFHAPLCCQGNPGQVVMVAAMGKLPLVLNAMRRAWSRKQPGFATTPHET